MDNPWIPMPAHQLPTRVTRVYCVHIN